MIKKVNLFLDEAAYELKKEMFMEAFKLFKKIEKNKEKLGITEEQLKLCTMNFELSGGDIYFHFWSEIKSEEIEKLSEEFMYKANSFSNPLYQQLLEEYATVEEILNAGKKDYGAKHFLGKKFYEKFKVEQDLKILNNIKEAKSTKKMKL